MVLGLVGGGIVLYLLYKQGVFSSPAATTSAQTNQPQLTNNANYNNSGNYAPSYAAAGAAGGGLLSTVLNSGGNSGGRGTNGNAFQPAAYTPNYGTSGA